MPVNGFPILLESFVNSILTEIGLSSYKIAANSECTTIVLRFGAPMATGCGSTCDTSKETTPPRWRNRSPRTPTNARPLVPLDDNLSVKHGDQSQIHYQNEDQTMICNHPTDKLEKKFDLGDTSSGFHEPSSPPFFPMPRNKPNKLESPNQWNAKESEETLKKVSCGDVILRKPQQTANPNDQSQQGNPVVTASLPMCVSEVTTYTDESFKEGVPRPEQRSIIYKTDKKHTTIVNGYYNLGNVGTVPEEEVCENTVFGENGLDLNVVFDNLNTSELKSIKSSLKNRVLKDVRVIFDTKDNPDYLIGVTDDFCLKYDLIEKTVVMCNKHSDVRRPYDPDEVALPPIKSLSLLNPKDNPDLLTEMKRATVDFVRLARRYATQSLL